MRAFLARGRRSRLKFRRRGESMKWLRVRSHGYRVRFLLAALTMSVLPGLAGAQDFRGGVGGKVTDESGGVLPGVTVTVMSVDTNVSNTAVTNDSGAYTFLYLTPGPYRVSAELQGFKKVQRDNVEVRVGDRLEIDFKLEVGGITEVVNVAADTPLLDAPSGSKGHISGEKRISL